MTVLKNLVKFDSESFKPKVTTRKVKTERITYTEEDYLRWRKRTRSMVIQTPLFSVVSGPWLHMVTPAAVNGMLATIIYYTVQNAKVMMKCEELRQGLVQGIDDDEDTMLPYLDTLKMPMLMVVGEAIDAVIVALVIWFALRTQFADPGILDPSPAVSRQLDCYNDEIYKEFMSLSEEERKEFESCQVRMNCSFYFRTRDCKTCSNPEKQGFRHFHRAPKSSHCSVCNNCVRGFDHHCYLLNNCVGRRNIKSFALFLLISFTGAIYMAFTSALQFVAVMSQYQTALALANDSRKGDEQFEAKDLSHSFILLVIALSSFVTLTLSERYIVKLAYGIAFYVAKIGLAVFQFTVFFLMLGYAFAELPDLDFGATYVLETGEQKDFEFLQENFLSKPMVVSLALKISIGCFYASYIFPMIHMYFNSCSGFILRHLTQKEHAALQEAEHEMAFRPQQPTLRPLSKERKTKYFKKFFCGRSRPKSMFPPASKYQPQRGKGKKLEGKNSDDEESKKMCD